MSRAQIGFLAKFEPISGTFLKQTSFLVGAVQGLRSFC